jgi:peptidoglycan/xylan/chitin deacetylase (PgdA/CDA1 family)
MNARKALLSGAKLVGGFWLADRVKPKGLPILCYHGFSLADEHRFRPSLFIRADRFETRLLWLLRNRYKVIPLSEAINRLDNGDVGKREVVITIDDGFYTVGQVGWPILRKYGLPATLYATTYYATHANPIFRLAMQYFFWRTRKTRLRLDDLSPVAHPHEACEVQAEAGLAMMWRVIHWAETAISEDERRTLAKEVATRLEVDYEELQTSRRLSLLKPEELRTLARDGLDIQLHTHRHNLPEDVTGVVREIGDNRDVLRDITGKPLVHFCYPSGIWSKRHWETLSSLGIESATTCWPGINESDTPRLALYRFLDSEDLSQKDFEAELTGFKTIIRTMRGQSNRGTFSY